MYLIKSAGGGQREWAEAIGDGVLVREGLVAVLVGVDGGDHADEVLVQARRLVRADDALGCKKRIKMRRNVWKFLSVFKTQRCR